MASPAPKHASLAALALAGLGSAEAGGQDAQQGSSHGLRVPRPRHSTAVLPTSSGMHGASSGTSGADDAHMRISSPRHMAAAALMQQAAGGKWENETSALLDESAGGSGTPKRRRTEAVSSSEVGMVQAHLDGMLQLGKGRALHISPAFAAVRTGPTECAVECGNVHGMFDLRTERITCFCLECKAAVEEGLSAEFIPSEFERHGGMAACKKWRFSIKVCCYCPSTYCLYVQACSALLHGRAP